MLFLVASDMALVLPLSGTVLLSVVQAGISKSFSSTILVNST